MKLMNEVRESLALSLTGQGNVISLHTADPGASGAGEVTGGDYARKNTTWTGGATDGVVAGSEVEFSVPGGTYTHIAVRSTAGTVLWTEKLPGDDGLSVPASKVRVRPTITMPAGS
jgi:hypothetical protein